MSLWGETDNCDRAYNTCEYDWSDDMFLYLIRFPLIKKKKKNFCACYSFFVIVYSFQNVCVYIKNIFFYTLQQHDLFAFY